MGDHNLLRWSGNAMVGRHKKALKRSEIEFAPSIDQLAFYDGPRERSASPDGAPANAGRERFITNIHHKTHVNARFARRGKMYSWGPAFEDLRDREHVRKRMKLCLEQFMPDAVGDVEGVLPNNVTAMVKERTDAAEEKLANQQWLLPHLRSPSPPLTSEELAPMLAIPQSYVDIMMSPSMRHTLGDDSMEQGLQRTASDLLEGEKPLLQALGRLKDTLRLLERDVPQATIGLDEKSSDLPGGYKRFLVPLPHVSDTDNLWRVTQELLQVQVPPTISYGISRRDELPHPPSKEDIDAMKLTPTQRLFTHPNGITITATTPSSVPPTPHHPPPIATRYNIDLANQVIAVDDAMERISELLADCNEYKTRLEEARDRIADVARARKTVWNVIKERAGQELDRYEGKTGELIGGQLL